MIKSIKILAVACVLSMLCVACVSSQGSVNDRSAKYQTALNSIFVAHPDAIGILVHVEAPNENLSWSGAVGFADKKKTTPLRPDHPVLIASNTKTYVAAAILRLVEKEKLDLKTPISTYLSDVRNTELKNAGYDPDTISLLSLLNHTSGIYDYNAIEGLFDFIAANPGHVWTKDEQISRAMTMGQPYGAIGEKFNYADTNYLLLGEIIENISGEPLHTGVRSLLDFEKQNLNSTWWMLVEPQPQKIKPIAHQYVTSLGLDSHEVHQSFDLFGGGGLAATSSDLALFTQNLFSGNVFKHEATLDIMTTPARPKEAMQGEYMLGLYAIDVEGTKGMGHGGFWGSAANYFPSLNASVSVIVLERDERALRADVNKAMVGLLKE